MTIYTENNTSMKEDVKMRKSHSHKTRCERAITSCGLSNQEFYEKVGISRQQWYYWSWQIDPIPAWLKVRLCDMFGKPFIDLFLIETTSKSELEPHRYHKQSSNVQKLNEVEGEK